MLNALGDVGHSAASLDRSRPIKLNYSNLFAFFDLLLSTSLFLFAAPRRTTTFCRPQQLPVRIRMLVVAIANAERECQSRWSNPKCLVPPPIPTPNANGNGNMPTAASLHGLPWVSMGLSTLPVLVPQPTTQQQQQPNIAIQFNSIQ